MLSAARLPFHFSLLLLAQIYTQGLTGLAGLLIVRLLSPSEYGQYTLAVAGLNIGSLLVDAGLAGYLNREAARNSAEESRRIWQSALRVRLKLALLVWLLTLGLVWFIPALGQPGLAAIASLALFPLGISTLTISLLNGQGKIGLSASLCCITATLNFGLTLAILVWQTLAVTLLTANLAITILNALLLLSRSGLSLKLREKATYSSRVMLKAGSGFFLIGLASIVYQYADIYLVSALLGEKAVAEYGAALRVLALLIVIPTVWGIAAMPHYAPAPSQNRRELLNWSLALTTIGIGLALSGYWLVEPLINLVFGAKYSQIAPILQILGWAGAGIFACAGPVTWLTITNHQYYILLALIITDLISLALGLFLAGYLQLGLNGIALARALSSWLLFILYVGFAIIEKDSGFRIQESE